MKIAGSGSASGSISQIHGSADQDPDPHQNVMDPQHCKQINKKLWREVFCLNQKGGQYPILTTVSCGPMVQFFDDSYSAGQSL
jgi:hypothetical protein